MDSTPTDPETATSTQQEQARCAPAQTYVWTTFDRSDWMGQQRPNLQGRRLLDLRLCGSHDTGTYSIVSLFDGAAVTQNAYLQDQLGAGLRYVNLRPGSHDGNLVLAHGIIWGSAFSDFVSPISAFCQAHPNEFLIVFVEQGNAIDGAQAQQLVQMLTASWGPLMVTSGDAWFDISTVTLGDIWNPQINTGGKRLLVLVEPSLLPSTLSPATAMQQGFWPPSTLQTGGWADKSQWIAVNSYVTAQLASAEPNKLFLAQLLLTPGGPGGINVRNMTGDAQESNDFGSIRTIPGTRSHRRSFRGPRT